MPASGSTSIPPSSDVGHDARSDRRHRQTPLLAIETLQVMRDRIVAVVQVTDPSFYRTTPDIAQRICEVLPDLPRHACVNDEGPSFGAVIDHTGLPHLFEHVVIDLETEASADADRVFTGTTQWLDRSAGRARVEVSFADDLVGLCAFRDAANLLNTLR